VTRVVSGSNARKFLPVFLVFAAYLALRLWGWSNGPLFEDRDSLDYLEGIRDVLAGGLTQIASFPTDLSPGFPAFGALFAWLAGSVETGARLCSLFFSCVLFLALAVLGRKLAKPSGLQIGVVIGLLLLALNPVLLRLSYSILSEPAYIGIVYLGWCVFVRQYEQPGLWRAAFLGLIFGLAFVTRFEGILYLAAIPLLQLVHYSWEGRKKYSLRFLSLWVALFVASFAALSAPQVWRTSKAAGSFSLNGRQVWSQVMRAPDGKSYDEKLYGLDHSPAEVNIEYLQKHPEESSLSRQVGTASAVASYAKLALLNLDELNSSRLGELVGALALLFFAVGFGSILRDGLRFDGFLLAAFIGIGFIGPLLHNVVPRHIAVVAPAMILVAGIGVHRSARSLVRLGNQSSVGDGIGEEVVSTAFLVLLVAPWVYPLHGVLGVPDRNPDYSPSDYDEPAAVVRAISEAELGRRPVVIDRKAYLAYFAGGEWLAMPYADAEGLLRYAALNHADFLFLDHDFLSEYPFMKELETGASLPGLELLYGGVDSRGSRFELFRIRNPRTGSPADPD